jgi:hypothetical protein
MKLLLTIIALIPFALSAQDCNIAKETDPYTKEVKFSSGFISLQGATVNVEANSKEIDFFFVIPGKCFKDATSGLVYFEGTRSRATIRNTGSMNCEGNYHFTFRNGAATTNVLKKLGTMKVSQFVFKDSDDKDVVIELIPAQQEALMKAASCVTENGKTLLKP